MGTRAHRAVAGGPHDVVANYERADGPAFPRVVVGTANGLRGVDEGVAFDRPGSIAHLEGLVSVALKAVVPDRRARRLHRSGRHAIVRTGVREEDVVLDDVLRPGDLQRFQEVPECQVADDAASASHAAYRRPAHAPGEAAGVRERDVPVFAVDDDVRHDVTEPQGHADRGVAARERNRSPAGGIGLANGRAQRGFGARHSHRDGLSGLGRAWLKTERNEKP